MKKKALTLIIVLVFSALAGKPFVVIVKANPFDLPVDTSIHIYSTNDMPFQDNQYENSTATLNIIVILVYGYYDQSWPESVHLDSICYSLDGQPLIYTSDFTVENFDNYGRDKQDFLRCTAEVQLENLSEGTHTVAAYANDTHNEYAYINDLSASYNFTVNSHQQIIGDTSTPSPLPSEEPQLTEPDMTSSAVLAVTSIIIFLGLLVLFIKRK